MKIRPARDDDTPALRRIYLETRRQAFDWADSAQFKLEDFDNDTAGERIWVATGDSDAPIGFVAVWMPEHFIHHLYVAPGMAGQGAGSALLSECLTHTGRPAALKCVSRNVKARDFYKAQGWQVVSEEDGPGGKYLLMHFT